MYFTHEARKQICNLLPLKPCITTLRELVERRDGHCFAYSVTKTAVSAYYLIFFSSVLVENLLLTALFVLFFAFSSPTTMVAELVEAALSP
jgi:hypothetical protein